MSNYQRADIRSRNRWNATSSASSLVRYGKCSNKKRKPIKGSKLDKKIIKAVRKNAIDSQDTQVQYFQRVVVNLNPSEGIYNPVVFAINPSGMDSLLPNYGNLTDGKQQIYIDYINIFIIYSENDLTLNDVKRNFIRHFITYKDDLTSATDNEITSAFQSSGTLDVVEEALTAVFPQSSDIYHRHDSGWLPYDSERGTSVSTGATITDIPNFVYPLKKYTISLKVQKNFSIAGNGTLLNWRQPTVTALFTGSVNSEPDVSMGYHTYYKVLA